MVTTTWGQTPDFRWARSGGTNGSSWCNAIAIDSAANIYAAGKFSGFVKFQQTNLISTLFDEDAFIAKFTQTGAVAWAKKAGAGGFDYVRALATDNLDNCYAAGIFQSEVTFDGITLKSPPPFSSFLTKYDQTGHVPWAIIASKSEIYAVAVDHSGSIYFFGGSLTNAMIDNVVLTNNSATGGELPLVAKCDKEGRVQWVKQAGASSYGLGYDIAVDGSNQCYITGFFNGTIGFGNVVLTNDGSQSIFLISFDSQGRALWGTQAGRSVEGPASTGGHGIKVDATGNIYLTGFFAGTNAPFGITNLTSRGDSDIFLAKYTRAGQLLWVKQAGGALQDWALAMDLDSNGNSYLTGRFQSQPATFGSTTITSQGSGDVFVAKYDASGKLIWVQSAHGEDFDGASGIALDRIGNCYVAGEVYSTNCLFGSSSVTANQKKGSTYFVARLDSYPPPLSIAQLGNKAVLSWPAWATGFEIQSKANFSPGENWMTLSSPITTIEGDKLMTDQLSNRTKFYRLRKD